MKVAIVGDVMVGRDIGKGIECGRLPLGEDVTALLLKHDVVLGNLESPITDTWPLVRPSGLRASVAAVPVLSIFSALGLANNHVFDAGMAGALETVSVLRANGIAPAGLVPSSNGVHTGESFFSGDERLTFFACATGPGLPSPSGVDGWEVLSADDPRLLADIRAASSRGDSVIVSVHGGNEFVALPPPTLIQQAQALAGCGATVIVTHHLHVVGGPSWTSTGSMVWWSLGDFVFDGRVPQRTSGVVISLDISGQRVNSWSALTTHIDDRLTTRMAAAHVSVGATERYEDLRKTVGRPSYDIEYSRLYLSKLARFQATRLLWMIRSKGVFGAARFAWEKATNVRHYLSAFWSGKHR